MVPYHLSYTRSMILDHISPAEMDLIFLPCSLLFTVNSLYLEHPLSRTFLHFEHPLSGTSLYLELKSRSLYVSCNLFFSLYLKLSLSRTNYLVPFEFEIERVNCIMVVIWPINGNFQLHVFIYITQKRWR